MDGFVITGTKDDGSVEYMTTIATTTDRARAMIYPTREKAQRMIDVHGHDEDGWRIEDA